MGTNSGSTLVNFTRNSSSVSVFVLSWAITETCDEKIIQNNAIMEKRVVELTRTMLYQTYLLSNRIKYLVIIEVTIYTLSRVLNRLELSMIIVNKKFIKIAKYPLNRTNVQTSFCIDIIWAVRPGDG